MSTDKKGLLTFAWVAGALAVTHLGFLVAIREISPASDPARGSRNVTFNAARSISARTGAAGLRCSTKGNMSQKTSGRITGSTEHMAEIDASLALLAEGQAKLVERLSALELKLTLATAPTPPPPPVFPVGQTVSVVQPAEATPPALPFVLVRDECPF